MDELRIVGVLGVEGDDADVWAIVKLSAPADHLLAELIERLDAPVLQGCRLSVMGDLLTISAPGFESLRSAAQYLQTGGGLASALLERHAAPEERSRLRMVLMEALGLRDETRQTQ